MKKSVVLFFLAAMSLAASAQKPEKIGDFWFTFSSWDPTSATLVADPTGGGYSGDLVIPAVVEHDGQECRVANIGKRAFSGTNILSVTIKGKLNDNGYGVYIQPRAFSYCKSLASVEIGDGVTSIGNYAFYDCPNLSNVVIGEEGKTLAYDTLKTSDEWQRRVITPANFKPRDDLYGNLGWDVISKAVTTISIAAYDDTEFWIDDVVLYGVKPSDFF